MDMDKSNLVKNRMKRQAKYGMLGIVVRLSAVLVGLYILLNVFLYGFQEKLIFFPRGISDAQCAQVLAAHSNVKDVSLRMKDGTMLHGWMLGSQMPDPSKLLIYFGGNGDEVSQMIGSFQQYPDWTIVLINYRGYGQSEGAPGEEVLFSDTLEIYDHFVTAADNRYAQRVVMGRSMGTGVAVYVAQNRPVDGVVLASPYDSVLSVAQEKFPMVPVEYLLHNRFDSVSRAQNISAPVLVCIAKQDEVIPPWHSMVLAQQFTGVVTIREYDPANHDSILQKEAFWQEVGRFLKKIGTD